MILRMGMSLSNISHQALAFFPAPYGVLVVKIGMRSKRNLNRLSQKEGSVASMISQCSPRTWPSKIPPSSFESNHSWMYRLNTSSGCSGRYTNCDYQVQPRSLSAACWAPNVRQWASSLGVLARSCNISLMESNDQDLPPIQSNTVSSASAAP